MPTAAVLRSKLLLDIGEFRKGLSTASNDLKSAGKSMTSAGQTMTKGLTLPLAAAGAALLGVGNKFDQATKTIRAGTGATGAALEGLEADFKAVLGTVPESVDAVAQAIADLNTRTGATGPRLQALTKQMLDLARVADEDAATTVRATTRLFGDWSVATDKQTEAMDLLWKTSQQTGAGVNQLQEQLVAFGAPLRQMGFTLEESAAMLGKWEKEGVNAERIMGAMSMAVGRFAREGKDAKEGMRDMIARIQELGPGAESTAMAIEAFGSRAGPDLAAAILEGRFELDEMMKTLRDSPETISAAAEATKSMGEKFSELKNRIMVAVEPLANEFFEALEKLQPHLEVVVEKLAGLVEKFMNLSQPAKLAIAAVLGIAAAIGPALIVLGTMVTGLGFVAGALAAVSAPALIAVGAVAAVGAALFVAWQKSETFRDVVLGAWDAIQRGTVSAFKAVREAVMPVIGEVRETIDKFVGHVTAVWSEWGDEITAAARAVWGTISNVIGTQLGIIKEIVAGGLKIIGNTFQLAMNLLQGDWSEAWDNIKGIAFAVGDAVVGIVKTMWEGIERQFSEKIDAIQEKLGAFKDKTVGAFQKMADLITLGSIWPDMWASVEAQTTAGVAVVTGTIGTFANATTSQFAAIAVAVQRAVDNSTASLGKMNDAVKGSIARLQEQVDKLGLSERQILAYDLAVQGATKSQIAHALSLTAMIEGYERVTERLAEGLEPAIGGVAKAIQEYDDLLIDNIPTIESVSQAALEMGQSWRGVWDSILSVAGTSTSELLGIFDDLTGGMASKVGDLFDSLDEVFGGGFGGILDKAGGFVKDIGGALAGKLGLGGVFGKVAGLIGGPWGAAITSALDLLGIDMVSIAKSIAGAVGDVLGGIGDKLGLSGGSKRLKILRKQFGKANIKSGAEALQGFTVEDLTGALGRQLTSLELEMIGPDQVVSDLREAVNLMYELLVRGGGGQGMLESILSGDLFGSMFDRAEVEKQISNLVLQAKQLGKIGSEEVQRFWDLLAGGQTAEKLEQMKREIAAVLGIDVDGGTATPPVVDTSDFEFTLPASTPQRIELVTHVHMDSRMDIDGRAIGSIVGEEIVRQVYHDIGQVNK